MLKKNLFPWNFDCLTSSKLGQIVPTMYEELEPGATINLKPNFYIKLAPFSLPTQGKFKMTFRAIFVPFRLIIDTFETLFVNPATGVLPYINVTAANKSNAQHLMNFFPFNIPSGRLPYDISARPIRTYTKAYNDCIKRNMGLQLNVKPTSGTSVLGTNLGADTTTTATTQQAYYPTGYNRFANLKLEQVYGGTDYSVASPITLTKLRELVSNARLKERLNMVAQNAGDAIAALFGTKPVENKYSTLITTISRDCDLAEVMSTADSTTMPLSTTVSVGMLRSDSRSHEAINFTAPEHGAIICMIDFTPYIYHVEGIRAPYKAENTPQSFYKPELAQLGLVPVYRDNFIVDPSVAMNDSTVIGYQPIYDELRKPENFVGGDYRETKADYVVHRTTYGTSLNTHETCYYNDFAYLFADANEPQVRFHIRYEGNITRPVPRVISDENVLLTENVINDSLLV